jgi:hypothetical protein
MTLYEKILSVRDFIIKEALLNSNENLPENMGLDYQKFISTILVGSIINTKHRLINNISGEDDLTKAVFQFVFKEAISFQEKYILTDKIYFNTLSYERMKTKDGLLFYIYNKDVEYSRNIRQG